MPSDLNIWTSPHASLQQPCRGRHRRPSTTWTDLKLGGRHAHTCCHVALASLSPLEPPTERHPAGQQQLLQQLLSISYSPPVGSKTPQTWRDDGSWQRASGGMRGVATEAAEELQHRFWLLLCCKTCKYVVNIPPSQPDCLAPLTLPSNVAGGLYTLIHIHHAALWPFERGSRSDTGLVHIVCMGGPQGLRRPTAPIRPP